MFSPERRERPPSSSTVLGFLGIVVGLSSGAQLTGKMRVVLPLPDLTWVIVFLMLRAADFGLASSLWRGQLDFCLWYLARNLHVLRDRLDATSCSLYTYIVAAFSSLLRLPLDS